MKRFLLDSGILGDLINHRNGIRERHRVETKSGNKVGTGVPIIAEMAYGIEYGQNRDRNMTSLRSVLATITIWPFDTDAAFCYGRISAELRRTGRNMQIIDRMIAAIALTIGNCTVVTKDSDLASVSGLDVTDWSNPTI